MRVAIDEQIFLLQRRGGVSRYFVELIRAFRDSELDVEPILPFDRVWNQHALDMLPELGLRPISERLAPYPALARAGLRRRRPARGVDLVHHTFYSSRFLRDYPARPKVVTIYDMIPEVMGQRGRFGNPHMAKREYVRRAQLLLFISESAREDLVATYGEPDAPCRVTHLGVEEAFFAGGPPPPGFPEQYLLFVGNRGGYKDFPVLLRAFAKLHAERSDLHLVCVGGGSLLSDELGHIDRLGLRGLVSQHRLADAQMPGAYAGAQAFVFPSRYEGFGLPVLEAMAAGTPAVLAETSSLPEVGGNCARYFAPGDDDQLAAQVLAVLDDAQLRATLVATGRQRAGSFTWANTARATARAYRSVLA